MENHCSTTDLICTDSQRVQTNMFFFSNLSYHKTAVIECAA